MNLVTGLWGMNVHVPGQDIETGVSASFSLMRSANILVVRMVWRHSWVSRCFRVVRCLGDGELYHLSESPADSVKYKCFIR